MAANRSCSIVIVAICSLSALCPRARAVTAEDAARLRGELTPLGAERAGNREGTIPAWDGGYTARPPGYDSGQPRPDPFAGDRPLFRITAANMEQYADRLSDGVKELLRRFPDYWLDVYPTHRTAAAPQWVYDNTFANATRTRATNGGLTVEGAFGGIPFPMPASGREAIWNHLLAWKGEAVVEDGGVYLASGAGSPVLTAQRRADFQYPYYYRDGSADRFGGFYYLARYLAIRPPSIAGTLYVVREPIDWVKRETETWAYLVGQRRVRPVPTLVYDFPDETTSGLSLIDEVWLFKGALDRYEWRILGKKELFVPYNENGFHARPVAEMLGRQHLNPDHVRWELHRVWVVEARLASGKRHVIARRRLYLDEDTWLALLYDGWDARGRLWKVAHALPLLVPELPAVVSFPDVVYDLSSGRYAARYLLNESRIHYQIVPRRSEDYFSPAALVGEGVR
jgi:hypothetical protein